VKAMIVADVSKVLWLCYNRHSDSNGGIYETRETTIPESHDPISEMVPRRHRMDKQVSMLIVQMLEQNQFTKNFGPKRIISELQKTKYSVRLDT